jgi:hypothetical protein
MEIPFVSSGSEDIGVGLNDCDSCVIKCRAQSIKIKINKKEWHQASKPLKYFSKSFPSSCFLNLRRYLIFFTYGNFSTYQRCYREIFVLESCLYFKWLINNSYQRGEVFLNLHLSEGGQDSQKMWRRVKNTGYQLMLRGVEIFPNMP